MTGQPELPLGWSRTSLEEVAEIVLGQSPPGSTYNKVGEGLPFFQGKAEFGDLYPRPVKWCTRPSKVAAPEDVLVSVRAPVGPTNLAPERSAIGRRLAALRPRNGMPSKYLLYAMRASEGALQERATGSTFEAVSGGVLRSHQINLAPQHQWDAIVATVEQQLTRLDSAIAFLSKSRIGLRRFEAARAKAAVLRELDSRGTAMGDTSSAWPVLRLPDISKNLDARRVPVNATERALRPGSTPYYGATGRVGWIDGSIFDEELVLLGEDGAPFLDPLAKKAYIIRGKSWVNNHAHVLRPDPAVMTAEYLALALNAMSYRGLVSGTTRLKLTQGAMNTIQLPVPPLDEQRAINDDMQRAASVVGNLTHEIGRAADHSSGLRRSILQAAFSGKLSQR